MKRSDCLVRRSLALAWLLALATASVPAAPRASCTPRPAGADAGSALADGLSMNLGAARPRGFVNWDARDWQRHRVWIALEATNAGDGVVHAMSQMVVDARADGGAGMLLRGLPLVLEPHAHVSQRLSLYVPDDARTLGVRVLETAPVGAVAVSLAVECSENRFDIGEVSAGAAHLLGEALSVYLDDFVDTLPDPRLAVETARRLASGAQDAGDVAWALRGVMQSLHDDRGFVVGPGEAPVRRLSATRAPTFEWRADGTAVVRLHPVGPLSDTEAHSWATALHDGIATLATHRPRGWIVDLRDHDGQSPWPSFAGLSTLLDGPSVGAFVRRHDREDWIVDRGAARIAGGPALVDLETPPEAGFSGPVAVLIGAGTMNAGEDVAVAFEGRAHTRFFGAATAGFPASGVSARRLSDGTILGVPDTRDADRTGRVHRGPIAPDVELALSGAADAVPQDAIDWVLDERPRNAPNR